MRQKKSCRCASRSKQKGPILPHSLLTAQWSPQDTLYPYTQRFLEIRRLRHSGACAAPLRHEQRYLYDVCTQFSIQAIAHRIECSVDNGLFCCRILKVGYSAFLLCLSSYERKWLRALQTNKIRKSVCPSISMALV